MRLPFQTDNEVAAGLRRFGVMVLQTDEIVEVELPQLLAAAPVRVHYSRVTSGPDMTPENLASMEAALPAAVGHLPAPPFDVVAYACTSGATIIGEDRVAEIIRQGRPGVAASNPLTAVKAALKTLGVTRLGFVTPYVAAVSDAMRGKLADVGIETVAFGSFEVAEDGIVAQMTPECILAAALSVGAAADCDGVFISCTNLRAAGIIEQAEAQLGKPVISSNQALAWHMLRLAGDATVYPGRGRLFTRPLP